MQRRSFAEAPTAAVATGLLATGALAWAVPSGVHTPSLRGQGTVPSLSRSSAPGSSEAGFGQRPWACAGAAAILAGGVKKALSRSRLANGRHSGAAKSSAAATATASRSEVLEAAVGLEDGVGANPATCWPRGKPAYTTEYTEEYDLADPIGSFNRVGRQILKEMVDELPALYELPQKEAKWVEDSLEYNTQGGKMNRGLIVVETGVAIMKHQGREPTNADLNRFAVLGWAVEYLQACMLMADDMMDGSVTRRGNPCWYRLPHVGLLNTNDFLMVEMFVYKILKRHFGQERIFPWLMDLFLETTFQTECGQLLDSICANCELEELTTERWTLIVKYKTAFYSFYLPVALAMLVTGVRDKKAFDTARDALLLMGIYFQAQDDYLDAFASPEVLGKVGTDIQDKKCSWLFAHAYHEQSTPEAIKFLDEHYGKCEVGSQEESKIKEVYRELGLQELFQEYEEDVENRLEDFKSQVKAADLPWSVFDRFFQLIHKRRK
ncbi:ERG20 [Symbiodinium microadriaticum]|nr:ERG20 [Symbiodinium sp. KB8]CAE7889499.1 ERG20 [Symbiodinium microadriaticum]